MYQSENKDLGIDHVEDETSDRVEPAELPYSVDTDASCPVATSDVWGARMYSLLASGKKLRLKNREKKEGHWIKPAWNNQEIEKKLPS